MRFAAPYCQSLALTLFFFYGTVAILAWIANNYPLGFLVGVFAFFLLIYGKFNWLVRAVSSSRATGHVGE